jgi:hypothetical protein
MQDPHEVAPDYVHATVFGFWPEIQAILQSQGISHPLGANGIFQGIGENWHEFVSFLQQNGLGHLLYQHQVPSMISVLFFRHLQVTDSLFRSAFLASRPLVNAFVQALQRRGIYLPEDPFIPTMIFQLIVIHLSSSGNQAQGVPQQLDMMVQFFLNAQVFYTMPTLTQPATFFRHAFM